VTIGTSLFANSGFAIGATTSSVNLYGTNAVTPPLTETAPNTTTSLSSQGTSLGGATYDVTGTAIAVPGLIRAQAQAAATAPNFGIPEGAAPRVDASASWSDVITFNAAGLTGQNGYINTTFQLTSGMAVPASANNRIGATAGAGSQVGFQVPGFVIGPSSFTAGTTDPSFSDQSNPLNNIS